MEIGIVKQIFRYPVKSMAGESLENCTLGWHGLEGDRRFAFRRMEDSGGFPWLTAGRLPALIRYQPFRLNNDAEQALPTRVRTPEGKEFELSGEDLRAEIAKLYGKDVQLMQFKHGIFDEAAVSLISLGTIHGLAIECGKPLDIRRFRPNLLVETFSAEPFAEDDWVGRTVCFGSDGPEISITLKDLRCAMVNLDPDTAESDPIVLKTAARMNEVCAGVYATVTKTGTVSVGQKLFLKS
ncbi:MAG TPA: MOSC domain-containing protein [Blastocatellia bacterium]|nr:MOSC domain-containing protein [Blastocatellia bacterium]HMY70379.1 MOSC domain-containing protein [Blastocatellia bacterium]HMZ21667.1 MOSC domain-containing protein [Blastocatellia bacterium]HNG34671.1 MOSC domain-containing protein [Blastocatellia bacterium]